MNVKYTVISADLSLDRTTSPLELAPRGVQVEGVTVLSDPTGAGASIAYGGGSGAADQIPLLVQGMSLEADCPWPNEGVYLFHPPSGGDLVLLISFAGGPRVSGAA